MRDWLHWVGCVGVVLALGVPALAQDAETRAEELQRRREEKAKNLEPPESGAAERGLLRLEQRRLLERLLSPPEGFYPKLGNITPGSGFAAGPGYRKTHLFGGPVDFSGFAAFSTMRYWIMEGRLRTPRLAGERVALDAYVRRSDYRHEPFYGIGQGSDRDNESFYALKNTVIGGSVTFTPQRWLVFGGSTEFLKPDVRGIDDDTSIEDVFNPLEAPGLGRQPEFLRHAVTAEVNYRNPRGNPRRGGKYAVAFQKYVDRDQGRFSFDRVDIDLQQYVPILRDRRVLALRAASSLATDDTALVPFYLQRTLGGPDDLRGFRRFRFRDENVLLLQAEYRWEIFTAVDGAIFYDAGTVAARPSELALNKLDTDYGIGFRFGTVNGVFLRIEGAFGSREGKHFILRYGHVF